MDTTRFFDKQKGIVYTTVKGDLTVEEIRASMAEMVASPDYRPDMRGLIDLRGVTKLLTTEDTGRLAQTIKSTPNLVGRSRRALLVGSDLSYGMYRMFEALVSGGNAEYRVFRDETEAREWLEEGSVSS